MRFLAPSLTFPLVLAIPASAQTERDPGSPPGAGVSAEDRLVHERMLVLDTHLDIPARWDDGRWDFGARHRYDWDLSQVDLPRMEEGGLDGGFLRRLHRPGRADARRLSRRPRRGPGAGRRHPSRARRESRPRRRWL